MSSQQSLNQTGQTTASFAPLDPKPIVENGESPTAIILAIAILLSITIGSISTLVRVILMKHSSR